VVGKPCTVNMKILVCEDEQILLTTLDFRLKKIGYEVILAKDGKEALAVVLEQNVDCIVADIMMPFVTGLELLDYIRQDMESQLPVIVMSALEDDDVVLQAFKLGANDFIAKPFKTDELILRIRRLTTQPQ